MHCVANRSVNSINQSESEVHKLNKQENVDDKDCITFIIPDPEWSTSQDFLVTRARGQPVSVKTSKLSARDDLAEWAEKTGRGRRT